MEAAMLPSQLRKDGLEKVGPKHCTVTAGVLHNTVEVLKLTLKSSVWLKTHLLRAVALGVGPLHPTSCALEPDHLPTAK